MLRTLSTLVSHIMTDQGIRTNPTKFEKVRDWHVVESVTEVKIFKDLPLIIDGSVQRLRMLQGL